MTSVMDESDRSGSIGPKPATSSMTPWTRRCRSSRVRLSSLSADEVGHEAHRAHRTSGLARPRDWRGRCGARAGRRQPPRSSCGWPGSSPRARTPAAGPAPGPAGMTRRRRRARPHWTLSAGHGGGARLARAASTRSSSDISPSFSSRTTGTAGAQHTAPRVARTTLGPHRTAPNDVPVLPDRNERDDGQA